MFRATLKSLLSRKLRLLLSGLAVVLGVMFVSGSVVLTDTLGRSFDDVFDGVYAHVDVQVHGEPNVAVSEFEGEEVPANLPAGVVDRVAAMPGVAAATGLVEADGARVIGSDGKVVTSFGPPRLGVNWTGEDELLQLREGRGPAAPDEIAIDAALADTAGLSVGDRVGVLTLESRRDFTLVGVFGFSGDRDSIGGVQMVAFTDPVAQELMLGEPDVWTAVDVQAAPGVSPEQLRDELAAALGDGFIVRTGAELADAQASSLKEELEFVTYLLLGFAGVAMLVGIFLILNTFSILVAQRLRELALTRAIGASRRQVLGSVLLEALIVGLVASTLGLAAGVGAGALVAALLANASSLPVAALTVPLVAVLASYAIGVLVTVVAALVPAVRAARVPPVAAMQEAATPDRPLTRLAVGGGLTAAGGAGLLGLAVAGTGGGILLLAGLLLAFIGVVLLAPIFARPVASVLGRLFSWSVPGKLGRRNSGRNPRRTAITATALMVGVTLVTGVGVIAESVKRSVRDVVNEDIHAELVIAGDQAGPRSATFDPAVLEETSELAGVAQVSGLYGGNGEVDGETTFVAASNDLVATREIFGLTATAGTLDTLGPGELVLDERLADEWDLAVGDRVEIQLPRNDAPVTYRVAGVYGSSLVIGGFLLPQEAATGFGIRQPDLGMVQLAPGASAEAVRAEIAAMLADNPEVSVTDRSYIIEQNSAVIDDILLWIQILLGLAIAIAVLGIINTLALSVLERTRELGLLRAVGLGRAATMRMITVEAVVISLFGALLGVAVGAGVGTTVVTQLLRDEGIRTLALPWSDMGLYLVLAALVGVIAAVLPAVRAARTNVLRAIAYE